MKRKSFSFIDAAWGSWGSGSFYVQCVHAPRGAVLLFYLATLALISLVQVFQLYMDLRASYQRFYADVGRDLPTFRIHDDGAVAFEDGEWPFERSSGNFMVALDPGGATDALAEGQDGMLATSEIFLLRVGGRDYRLAWGDALPLVRLALGDSVVSAQTVYEGRDRIIALLALAFAPFVILLAALVTQFAVGLFTLTGVFAARTHERGLPPARAWRICTYALFPPALIYCMAVAAMLNIPSQAVMLACTLMYSMLVVRGIAVQQPPRAPRDG